MSIIKPIAKKNHNKQHNKSNKRDDKQAWVTTSETLYLWNHQASFTLERDKMQEIWMQEKRKKKVVVFP